MKKPLRKTEPHQVRSTARFSAVASASVALALCVAVPATAFADVRQDDQVAEKTVADRGLDDSQCPDIAAERVYVVGQDGTVYFQRNDSHRERHEGDDCARCLGKFVLGLYGHRERDCSKYR